jgi:membrane-bound ClpP family serine protease
MMILKPIKIGILTVIMLIGIVALITELTQYEEVAKIVVIPSLVLLIIVSGYAMITTSNLQR